MNNNFNRNGQFDGWTPPYYAGGNQMFNEQYYNFSQKELEKEKLKKIGSRCGLAVILYVLISYALSFVVVFTSWIFPSINKIYSDSVTSLAFDIVVTIISIGIPFIIIHKALKKDKLSDTLPFGTVYDKKEATYLVMMFLPLMIFSAIGINYISAFFQSIFGVEFTSSVDGISMKGLDGTAIGIIAVAFVPAIVEETAIRGIVMQPLRKFGDRFAIISSAVLFAFMHGNMVQIPYTVIGGLLLGYLAVTTGSLWPSIILHFINNFYSVLVVSLSDNFSETVSVVVTYVMLLVFALVGVFGVVRFARMKYRIYFNEAKSRLSAGEKIKAFVSNGPMITALVLLTLITISNIKH